jgi:hypothetical protein
MLTPLLLEMRSLREREEGNFDGNEIVMLRDFGVGFTHSRMGRASGYHNSPRHNPYDKINLFFMSYIFKKLDYVIKKIID